MPRGYELATAYISLAAESSSIPKQIGEAFAKGDKIALSAGKSMGRAVSKGYSSQKGPDFDKLAADAKKADDQVAASAERAAKSRETSSRKVEIAELKVQEVRERSIRQDAEVKNAEKALSDARKSGDTDRVVAAEKGLADARERVKPTSADLAAEDRLAAARDAQKLSTQKAEAELAGYRQAQEKANAALDEAKRAADSAEGATERAGNAFSQMGGRVEAALKGDFKGAFKGVDREARKSADNTVEEFDDAGDDAGGGMLDGLKGALLGAGGALGIGASFGELFQQGMESVSSKSKLKAALGLSDKDAAELGKDAVGAYKNGWGEDLATTTDVTAAASMYLGPNVDTQWATEMSIAMSEAFGTDPQENIKAVAQMIRTGMVKDAKEGFDVLTKGYQSGADKAGDLTDTMTEYGTQFRNLGIGGADAIGLMSQGLNLGARDADKVADAFKEFGIRAVDGSEATKDAFSALGLDADDMAARIGAGGQTARDATQEVLEKLGAVEDPATRAQIAVGLFGTQAEDLGSALYGLDLDTAASGMGEVAGSTQTMADALSEAQSPFDRIKRSFADIGTSVGSGMLPALDIFADIVIGIGEFFRDNPLVFVVVAAGITAMGVAALISSGAFASLGTAIWAATGPVGLVIAGITLLVAGLVWFFTKTELGQKIWETAWGAIKSVAAAVADWFMNTAVPLLNAAWDGIAAGATWLYQNVIKPVWGGIQTAIGAVVGWLVNTAWPLIKGVWDAIAAVAQWLWQSVIQPVWDGIRIAIAIAVTAITVYIDLMKWYFNNVIAPVAVWLWRNVMKPVWEGIKSAIGAVVTWFRDTAWPILSSVIGWIRAKFEQFKLGLQIIWRFIKNNVIAPVVSWFQNTVWPILSTVIGWIRSKFEQFKLALQIIWRFIRNNVIAPFVNWFRDHVWPLISRIIGYIKTGFNAMRDAIKAAWGYVKDKAIAPVVNWFSDTVKPKIDEFTGKIKDAFDSLKESVLEAWGAIKSGMKKPINGVIDIYNEHIAGNFNSVADTLGLDDKYRLKEMAGFATGGYTGPGSKYKEAGIVHADEYVIRKESQRGIERSAPGFLDALNRHGSRALGYASGGLVKLRMPFAGSYPRGDGYGARGGKHKGIDWPIPAGTALKAVAAGTARRTPNATAGNKLELSIGNGLTAGYHHMSRYAVASGASVGRGADIGYVGSTGRSSGPHLHFSLKRDGKYVDPAPYLGAGGSAGSGDGGGWWNPFTNLWSSIKGKVSSAVGDTPVGGIVSKVAENTISGIGSWVTDKITAIGDVVGDVADTTGGYARWSPIASAALALEGEMGPRNLGALMRRMKQESGYNPRAINNWDSNASRGTPSKGLMQVIDPTFRAYARPGFDKDIWDPMSNILASIRYARARYGDVRKGWDRKGGYADGGLVGAKLYDQGGWLEPGEVGVNQSSRPEPVFTGAQWDVLSSAAFSEQSVIGSQPRIHIEHAGLQPADVVDEMEKREHRRRALQVKVRS